MQEHRQNANATEMVALEREKSNPADSDSDSGSESESSEESNEESKIKKGGIFGRFKGDGSKKKKE